MYLLKKIFTVYPEAVDNFHFWGALIFFIIFLAYTLLKKIFSEENYSVRLRRLHFKFFIPYLLTSFIYALYMGKVNTYPLGSLLAGCFIYFSLLYVYLFSLLNLAKSVSVELLGQIQEIPSDDECTQEKLMQQFLQGKKGIEYMHENGIRQMLDRGWVQEKGSSYHITPYGRRINNFIDSLLKFLDLVRY